MLAKLEGYAAALLGSLDRPVLNTVADDLALVEQTVLSRSDLRAVLTDTSISGVARGQIVRDLLDQKVHASCARLVVFAATCVPAQDVPHSVAELAVAARRWRDTGSLAHENLSLMSARRRVGGFADALLEDLDTGAFARVEKELFGWARTVEGNAGLRRLLLDRDAPLAQRLDTTNALLANKVDPATLRLAHFVIEGGRARDVVGTLDFLVDYVARARDWRVARVHTARPLDEASQTQLVGSLASLTGKNVELQIADDPSLLGGVLVEVGDLRLDATTRGRLTTLRDAVASGHFYESAMNRND
jgi:F-type H+-transporting ATPase subunit delta